MLFGGVHRGFTPPSSGALKILNFGGIENPDLDLEAEKSWNKGKLGSGKFKVA